MIETTLPKLEKDLSEASAELREVTVNEKKLHEEVGRTRAKFSEAQSSFSSNRSRNRVLSFIMQLKSEGKCPGVFGRLGDLGAIDEKYDVAVSTACGSLDCIIVDNIDTAQSCIEHLKQGGVGSATFMALDKQEKWREHFNRKQATPENVPRLVDLIKVNDQRLLNAFYYSLRNTLVANDLEQASRIAYGQQQRHRVVTLKGEIIEVSGTMSGGGCPMKGRMGSRISTDEYTAESIKKMQDTLSFNEQELKQMVKRKQELMPLVETLSRRLEESKEIQVRARFEVKSLHEQIGSWRKNEMNLIARLREVVPDEAAQQRLEANIAKCRGEYERAEAKASKVRADNDEISKKILETSKAILDGPKEQVKQLEKEISAANTQILNYNVEIKTATRNLTNSEKKLTSFNEELEQHQVNLVKYNERLEKIAEESKETGEKYEVTFDNTHLYYFHKQHFEHYSDFLNDNG